MDEGLSSYVDFPFIKSFKCHPTIELHHIGKNPDILWSSEYHWSSRWSFGHPRKLTHLPTGVFSVLGQKVTTSNIDLQTISAEKYILGTALMNVLQSAQTHISHIQFRAR